MYFEVYRDKQDQWRWRLKSANHKTIAVGEGYINKQDCLHCIDLVKETSADTPVEFKES